LDGLEYLTIETEGKLTITSSRINCPQLSNIVIKCNTLEAQRNILSKVPYQVSLTINDIGDNNRLFCGSSNGSVSNLSRLDVYTEDSVQDIKKLFNNSSNWGIFSDMPVNVHSGSISTAFSMLEILTDNTLNIVSEIEECLCPVDKIVNSSPVAVYFSVETYEKMADSDIVVKYGDSVLNPTNGLYNVTLDSEKSLSIVEREWTGADTITATFHYYGDKVACVELFKGQSINKTKYMEATSEYTREGYDLVGWYFDSDYNSEFSGPGFVSTADYDVYAKWLSVDSGKITFKDIGVTVKTESGMILHDGSYVDKGTTIIIEWTDPRGFEFESFSLSSQDDPVFSKTVEVLVQNDLEIEANFTYSSVSNALTNIVSVPTPLPDDNLTLIWKSRGQINTTMNVWTGFPSIPLIVDDSVYARINDDLLRIDIETGYVISSVHTDNTTVSAFYHYLGYGGGMIFDYATYKVYDTELEYICDMDKNYTAVFYDSGYYYGLYAGKVFKFSIINGLISQSTNGDWASGIETNWHGLYGATSTPVFESGHIYFIEASGDTRAIGSINVEDGEYNSHILDGWEKYLLDDGWLTYYETGGKKYLFTTVYNTGLFEIGNADQASSIVCIPLAENGTFLENDRYYTISGEYAGGSGAATSAFVVLNDRGYVNTSGRDGAFFYVFDVKKFINSETDDTGKVTEDVVIYRESSRASHGSIVISDYYYESTGKVYIYLIPYSAMEAIDIFEDYSDKTSATGAFKSKVYGTSYCSQAIRAGPSGQIIWYDDSGSVFCYSVVENNPYYFFIDDGQRAGWYVSHGKNIHDAIKSLDSSVINIDSTYEVSRINGISIENASIIAVHGKENELGAYIWSNVDSFANRNYDTDHYFIIAAGDANVQKGSVYTYWDGSAFRTYSFKENIGDRSIIGVQMVPGNSASLVQFFEGDEEIDDSYIIGIVGSDVLGDFPRVHKDGYLPVWKDSSGNKVTSLAGTKFVSGGTIYWLSWESAFTYDISVTKTEVKDNTLKLEYTIETTDESGLNIQVQAAYSDMTFVREPIEAKIAEDGKIVVTSTITKESTPVKALVTVYKGNILVLAEYIDLTEGGSS